MCGISGIFVPNGFTNANIQSSIERISHRGPDEVGFYEETNCRLGICRLAIIDVKNGQQPCSDDSETIISIFNGEIYNFLELRSDLVNKGYRLRSQGDSELIPYLYREYGPQFLTKLQGMFAIALFDKRTKKLLLARDRLGKKPLWYSAGRNSIAFSSELKGLFGLGVKKNVNLNFISEYLSFGYINSPRSAYENVSQLNPGNYLLYENGVTTTKTYWDCSDVPNLDITFQDARTELKRLLRQAVATRLVSERPIGAFLSGGVDSTIITALMQQESRSQVHSFSIGFDDDRFDESRFASKVANAIGTKHHEFIVKPDPAIFEKITAMLDQPFADSSIVPTFLLAKFAREQVVVALSGDGGDETFGGYERYRAASFMDSINILLYLNPLQHIPVGKLRNQRLRKLIKHSNPSSLLERYRGIQSLLNINDLQNLVNPDLLRKGVEGDFAQLWNSIPRTNSIRQMQEMDLKSYLPADLMFKADIASMAHGLEVRSPFLDYRVVEFGLSLPTNFKVHGGVTKFLLREYAGELVPRKFIDRPKKGFGIPRSRWIREDLKDLVYEVSVGDSAKSRGWVNTKKFAEVLDMHQRGYELDSIIWPIFMLELWAQKWLDSPQIQSRECTL